MAYSRGFKSSLFGYLVLSELNFHYCSTWSTQLSMYFRLFSFPLRARSRSLCPATFQRHPRLLSFVWNNLFLGFYHVSLRCFAPASVQGERRLRHRHRQRHCCLHLGQSFPTQRKIQDSQRAVFFAFRIFTSSWLQLSPPNTRAQVVTHPGTTGGHPSRG